MLAVGAERQRRGARHLGGGQRAIEVREQRAVARLLPTQPIPETRRLDRNEDEPGLPGAMAPRAFGDLGGGREVDETVAPVVLGAGVGPRLPPLPMPLRGTCGRSFQSCADAIAATTYRRQL